MAEEPLFDYYDYHLTGLVVSNREAEPRDDGPDDNEPELL